MRVAPGETVREHIELVRAPSSRAAKASATVTGPGAGEAPPGADRPPGSAAPPDAGRAEASRARLRPWAWVAGAGAVGGLAFGVIETFQRAKFKKDFDGYALPNPADPANPTRDYCNVQDLPPECRGFKSDFDRSQTLMIVGYAVGGALAVTSAVLFVLSQSSPSDGPESGRQARVACVPDVVSPGVACRLVF